MPDHSALRQLAQSQSSVTVDSAQLLDLLEELDRLRGDADPEDAERRKKRRFTPDDEKCARYIFGVILATYPKAREPNWSVWSDEVRKMREIDKRAHREICELLLWASKDSFWCSNVLSPVSLRKQWDRLAAQKARPGGASSPSRKFNFAGGDRSADRAAQQQSMTKRRIVVPDGEVKF
jgi:hypothetical protein